MKRFAYTVFAAVVLPLAACNQPIPSAPPPATPPTSPDKPKVDVQAPGRRC